MTNIHKTVVSLPLASLVVAVAFATLSAAGLTGSWDIDGDVMGHPVKFSCTLDQQGDKLTGTAKIEGSDVPLSGSVEGTNVTWSLTAGGYDLVFTGSLGSENDIRGTIAVSGAEGVFTAKRQAP
jgi:hypothetical protein